MKTYTFTINGHDVTVEAVQALGRDKKPIEAVDFTARCAEKVKTSRLALHPKANKTAAQMEKNMADEALRLATAVAGSMQSAALLGSIFGGIK